MVQISKKKRHTEHRHNQFTYASLFKFLMLPLGFSGGIFRVTWKKFSNTSFVRKTYVFVKQAVIRLVYMCFYPA